VSRQEKTWLVTGCSSGLGRAIAEEVLASGKRVVVTARSIDSARAIASQYPDRALALAVDVTDAAAVETAVSTGDAWSGGIDVLVNNAAYGLYGAVEEVSDDEMLRLFQTNVFGVARLTRAVLPGMRGRRQGTIVNIGSIAGIVGTPGNGFYAASKFALEGLSEALQAEVGPLGIRVILLEPSGIRTNFHNTSYARAKRVMDDYEKTAGGQIATFLGLNGRQAGDPHRIARLLMQLVDSDEPPFRLLVGAAAVDRARPKMAAMLDGINAWESVSRSTDFDRDS
jgi:NAD(P)-dependent dehydrogenase (short-subunit alcohol dehydrogenase family)